MILLLPILAGSVAQFSQVEVPQELLNAARARAAETADIEWVSSSANPDGDRQRAFTSKVAGDRQLFVMHGDLGRDGVQNMKQYGEPYSFSEFRFLISKDEVWDTIEDSLRLTVGPPLGNLGAAIDGRTLGFFFSTPNDCSVEDSFQRFFERRHISHYTVQDHGDQCEVTAHYANGTKEHTWWLDKKRGWSPVRVVSTVNGAVTAEMLSTLREVDGYWFPEKVEHYVDGSLDRTDYVTRAAFNQPSLPRSLGLPDLGALPGMMVLDLREKEPSMQVWDGESVVPFHEFMTRVERGEIEPTAYRGEFERIVRDGPGRKPKPVDDPAAGLVNLERTPGRWEEYVRRFIRRHQLDPVQTRKAWDILDGAQTVAARFLEEHERDLKEVDRKIDAARADEQRADRPAEAQAKREALEQAKLRLLAPIELIFRTQLQPRLESLLTPTQKNALAAKRAPEPIDSPVGQ